MNQKDRLLLNTGFIFFGFGFAMNEYVLMALFCACIAVMIAIASHSVHVLLSHLSEIIPVYVTELFCIHFNVTVASIPLIRLLSLTVLISAACWMESSEKVIGGTMKGMTAVMFLFYVLSLCLKETAYGTGAACLIVSLIFLPFSLSYAIHECRYMMTHKNKKRIAMEERRILQ